MIRISTLWAILSKRKVQYDAPRVGPWRRAIALPA